MNNKKLQFSKIIKNDKTRAIQTIATHAVKISKGSIVKNYVKEITKCFKILK